MFKILISILLLASYGKGSPLSLIKDITAGISPVANGIAAGISEASSIVVIPTLQVLDNIAAVGTVASDGVSGIIGGNGTIVEPIGEVVAAAEGAAGINQNGTTGSGSVNTIAQGVAGSVQAAAAGASNITTGGISELGNAGVALGGANVGEGLGETIANIGGGANIGEGVAQAVGSINGSTMNSDVGQLAGAAAGAISAGVNGIAASGNGSEVGSTILGTPSNAFVGGSTFLNDTGAGVAGVIGGGINLIAADVNGNASATDEITQNGIDKGLAAAGNITLLDGVASVAGNGALNASVGSDGVSAQLSGGDAIDVLGVQVSDQKTVSV